MYKPEVDVRGVFHATFYRYLFIFVYIFLFSSINYTLVFDIKQKKDRRKKY